MPLDNLAKVFAPTLIDHSSADLDPNQMYGETMIQVAIMTNLLNIPGSYWNQFTNTNLVGYSVTSSSEPERDIPVAPEPSSSGSVGQNPKYYVGGEFWRIIFGEFSINFLIFSRNTLVAVC